MKRWAWLVVLVGCTPKLEVRDTDPGEWQRSAVSAFPDARAVVLLAEEEILTVVRPRRNWFTERRVHDVIEIRTESGFDLAKRSWRLDEGRSELVEFRARNILPSGEVVEVGRDAILEETEYDAEDDEERSIKTFTFPRVVVGSILEVQTLHRYDSISFGTGRFPMRDVPVKRYRLVMSGSNEVRWAMRAFNSKAGLGVEKDAGPGWRLTWALDDLPARPKGDFLPHRSATQPWVRFRVKQVVFPYVVWNFRNDWKGVHGWAAESLYLEQDKWLDGFEEKVDVDGCGGAVRCKIDRAVDWVRTKTHYAGRGGVDPLKEVMETGKASNEEKARILWVLLDRAGVTARFAKVRLFRTWTAGLSFPNAAAFNHVVVYVPEQEGLAEALWIDPSCEACDAGELPQSSRGVPAQILWAWKKAKGSEVTTRSATTKGKPLPSTTMSDRLRLRLDGDGTLHGELTATRTGVYASWRLRDRRTWSQKQWKDNAEDVRADRWPTGVLSDAPPGKCEKRPARCERTLKFEIPEYATEVDGQLVVPLSVVDADRADFFEKPERTFDISVEQASTRTDRVELTIPKGWRVAALPKPMETRALGFASVCTARVEGDVVHVERTITFKPGGYDKKHYEALRKPVRAFVDVRAATITLEKVPAQ